MRRISLCLLVALASTGVVAREVKLSSPDGGSCPEAASPKVAKARPAPVRDATPAPRNARSRPSLHSDSDGPGLSRPGRWHSFLPGMFR